MALKTCTQCGNCVDQCPVYALLRQEQTSPKGKHVILRAVAEKVYGWKQTLELTRLCAGCERCATVCPAKLSVPEALAEARHTHPDLTGTAWKIWISYGSLLWPVASCTARLLPKAFLPGRSAQLARSAAAMRAPKKSRPWIRFEKQAAPTNRGEAGNALLFSGCTAGNIRPDWAERARQLLLASGYNVSNTSRFTCCGGTLLHAGLTEAARVSEQNNLSVWEQAGRPPIFTFCASCHHTLERYAENMDDLRAEAWQTALRPLSALLLDKGPVSTGRAPACPAYHQPCHRTGKDTDLALLRTVFPEIRKGSALCCGMGGVLKLSHPGLSERLARQCWQGLTPEGSDITSVVSGCSGCVLQLAGTAPPGVEVRHWLDIVEVQSGEKPCLQECKRLS